MTADQFELARAALLSGQREQARSLLMQVVRLNPGHGEAWYLLGQTLDDPAQRADCEARARSAGFSPAPTQPPPPAPAAPELAPPPLAPARPAPSGAPAPELSAATQGVPAARPASKGLLAIASGLGLVVLLALAWLVYRQSMSDSPEPTTAPAPPVAIVEEPATRTPRPTRLPTTPTVAPTRPPVPTPTLPQILPVTVTPGPEGVATGGAGAVNPTPTSGSPAPTGAVGEAGERPGQIAYGKTGQPGQINIYIADADGGNERRLTNLGGMETSPAWSPDGKQIAFIATVDSADPGDCYSGYVDLKCNFEIYTINVDGTNLRRVTNNEGYDREPSWSPDGKRLVYESLRNLPIGRYTQLYMSNSDGSNEVQLTNEAAGFSAPHWSPINNTIVFSRDENRASDIYAMDVDQRSMTRLTKNSRLNYWPAWSADGTQIAFYSRSPSGVPGLYIMNADGSEERQVDSGELIDGYRPSWSPDGAEIAFVSDRDGQYAIYAVEIATNAVRAVTPSDARYSAPAWSAR